MWIWQLFTTIEPMNLLVFYNTGQQVSEHNGHYVEVTRVDGISKQGRLNNTWIERGINNINETHLTI